jgi:hypothetical protein
MLQSMESGMYNSVQIQTPENGGRGLGRRKG